MRVGSYDKDSAVKHDESLQIYFFSIKHQAKKQLSKRRKHSRQDPLNTTIRQLIGLNMKRSPQRVPTRLHKGQPTQRLRAASDKTAGGVGGGSTKSLPLAHIVNQSSDSTDGSMHHENTPI